MLLNQAFLTKCIVFLLYLSIIISVEREGIRVIPLGMKEMKEILIHKNMLKDVVDNGFWEVQRIRKYFLDELIHTDYTDYTIDSMGDSNELLKAIYETKGDYVTPELARKVSLYYKAEQELIADIRFYLLKEYDIDYLKELETRKNTRKERK